MNLDHIQFHSVFIVKCGIADNPTSITKEPLKVRKVNMMYNDWAHNILCYFLYYGENGNYFCKA